MSEPFERLIDRAERHDAALRRLRTSTSLIGDIDLDNLSIRYGGLGSTEHDEVQTLIAYAQEIRHIARELAR